MQRKIKFCMYLFIMLISIQMLTACSKKETSAESTVKMEEAKEEMTVEASEENEAADADQIVGGVSKEQAQALEYNTLYHGEYAEGEIWVSFTTGAAEETSYYIILDNLTVGSEDLYGSLVDVEGKFVYATSLGNGSNGGEYSLRAKQDGMVDTAMFDKLLPDTTYYLKLKGKGDAAYSIRISDSTQKAFDVAEGRETLEKGENLAVLTNQDNASILTANVRYQGSYENGYQWVAFRTGDAEEDPYKITTVTYQVTVDNMTVGSEDLFGVLVDEYGRFVSAAKLGNGSNGGGYSVRAKQDGMADTATFDSLLPNSTYFLVLHGNSRAAYSVRFTDHAEEAYDTTEGRTMLSKGETLTPVTNQDQAPILTSNTKYQGNYESGNQWVAFRTGDMVEDPNKITETIYQVTVENMTAGSEDLFGIVVDEYGYYVNADKLNNGSNGGGYSVRAKQDGTADTAEFHNLQPNTTYFLQLHGGTRASYVINFTAPGDSQMSGDEESESDLFAMTNEEGVPGHSQTFALHVPLETTVAADYTEGYSWLAFTTTEKEEAEYYVTLVNCTSESEDLFGILVDEYGNYVNAEKLLNGSNGGEYSVRSKQNGRADTAVYKSLKPNRTYYMRVQSKSKAAYSFRVSSSSLARENAYNTSSNIAEVVGTLDENTDFEPETNQMAAPLIKKNTHYYGSYIDGYAWVSFTTGDKEDAEYNITLENLTEKSEDLFGILVDEYGYYVNADKLNNGSNGGGYSVRAKQDGTADTAILYKLNPNTTYYLVIYGKSKADYILTIGAPEAEESTNTMEEEETAVFKVPLELNHSLIQFKGDLAEFVDPVKVQEVLKPVAEVILAHPDHPILLVGTTAWAGKQEDREVLSLNRAEAVKEMLVENFGVPEEQLLTIGLGFEKDPFERGKDRDANGRFVETEGAKNRRVLVLDAESEIGKQISGE